MLGGCSAAPPIFFVLRGGPPSSGPLRLSYGSSNALVRTAMSQEFSFKRIVRHRGDHADFGRLYASAATEAVAIGGPTLRVFASNLLAFVADFRNLRLSAEHLRLQGGNSPGIDGARLEYMSRIDLWELLRKLEDELKSGQYHRGPLRRCRVPKHPGSTEKRTIQVSNLRDRIVMRAAAQSLQPILAPMVDPFAFCWPKRGVRLALAHARHNFLAGERPVWIVEDIRGAFDHVPRRRLASILERYIPCAEFCRLILELVEPPTRRGITQGSALSPLLLELFLAHYLHRPWRRTRCGPAPLLRYVDDICVPCRNMPEAENNYERLSRLLQSAGFKAKHGRDQAIVDLRSRPATWLGYRLRLQQGQLRIQSKHFGDDSSRWEPSSREVLYQKFERLHEFPDSWQRPNYVILGLIGHLAPTLPWADARRIYREVADVAQEAGFDEILGYDEFRSRWQAAFRRWEETYEGLASLNSQYC